MGWIDRLLLGISPQMALQREKSRLAYHVIKARYEAASSGPRGSAGRAVFTDANTAAQRRDILANIGRDMERNSPYATRIMQVITNAVVGDGIIPKVVCPRKRVREALMTAVKAHFDTTAIDADGRNNLYGLQRLAQQTVVRDGEVLIRRRRRDMADGFAVPFQIQVLETDYLASTMDGTLPSGNLIRDGIEYDQIGRRVAYHVYAEHPGATGQWLRTSKLSVRRVPASEMLHIHRVDRPGQSRGVSWLAPIAVSLNDLGDYMDAQIMRQKIAALFTAFRTSPDDDSDVTAEQKATRFERMSPGRIENLLPGETISFADPPGVDGLSDTARLALRAAAVGVGITYEALTGDLSQVNFTSGRMGRMDMNANVSSWQWLLMMPQMMMPIGNWFLEAFQLVNGPLPAGSGLGWVPPRRVMVDPAREVPALVQEIRAGLSSWSGGVRSLGYDPEELIEEIIEDTKKFDDAKLTFDSDARRTSGAGQAQFNPGTAPVNPDGGQDVQQQ